MPKLSQIIYKHDVIVNSKINENAPKVRSTLWHCLIWQMQIQLYLLLKIESKQIIGFVLATNYPPSLHQRHHIYHCLYWNSKFLILSQNWLLVVDCWKFLWFSPFPFFFMTLRIIVNIRNMLTFILIYNHVLLVLENLKHTGIQI